VAGNATWSTATSSAIALGPRKTKTKLDHIGQSEDLPD